MRTLTTNQARKMARQRKTYGAGPGRPVGWRKGPRCSCGAMTLERAKKRHHVC